MICSQGTWANIPSVKCLALVHEAEDKLDKSFQWAKKVRPVYCEGVSRLNLKTLWSNHGLTRRSFPSFQASRVLVSILTRHKCTTIMMTSQECCIKSDQLTIPIYIACVSPEVMLPAISEVFEDTSWDVLLLDLVSTRCIWSCIKVMCVLRRRNLQFHIFAVFCTNCVWLICWYAYDAPSAWL